MSQQKLKQIKELYADLLKVCEEKEIREVLIKSVGTASQLLNLTTSELDLALGELWKLKTQKDWEKSKQGTRK
jgi:hypothetical protein